MICFLYSSNSPREDKLNESRVQYDCASEGALSGANQNAHDLSEPT